MSDVQRIAKGKTTYALFFSRTLCAPEGVRFLTEPDMPLQVGLMERPAGHVVKPHNHGTHHRALSTTPEFLYIESGKIRVDVFDDAWEPLRTVDLCPGDFLLLLAGGHAVEVLETARFIEVKQGPFAGPGKDKISPPVL